MKPTLRIVAIVFSTMVFSVSSAFAATVYTGDTIDGKKVISQLDLNDLAPEQIHKFLFEGVDVVSILTNTDKCKDGCEYNGDE